MRSAARVMKCASFPSLQSALSTHFGYILNIPSCEYYCYSKLVLQAIKIIAVRFTEYHNHRKNKLDHPTRNGFCRSLTHNSSREKLSTFGIAKSNLRTCYHVTTSLRDKIYDTVRENDRFQYYKSRYHLGKIIFVTQSRTYFTSPANFFRMTSDDNSDSNVSQNDVWRPREFRIKNAYGHVACLEWGRHDAPNKILCIHGWLDNAGSFERLIPFMLGHENNHEKYHIVAMDMPGVGHSSHRPPGSEYTIFSNVIEMRRVTQQLGWHQNLTLLAHSLGGHLSLIYSCIYPRQVSTLVSIDTTHPITHQVSNWNVAIGNAIEHFFKCENYDEQNEKLKTVQPVYTEADALKRLMDAHGSSLTYESAKVMFKRGATQHENGGCTFNRDVRHRHPSVEFRPTDDMMLKLMENTFAPNNLMIIRATRSPYHRPEMRAKYYELYERNCKLFHDIVMEGTHHVHMNSPEEVGLEICKFLEMAHEQSCQVRDKLTPLIASETPPINKPNL